MKNEWSDLAAYKEQIRQELKAEYDVKLKALEAEYEKTLEEGYEEAYQMICEVRDKNTELQNKIAMLEGMGPEYEAHVKQEREELGDYEERLSKLEVELYNEFDQKLKDAREYIVDKVDQFLEFEWQKLCEAGQQEFADKLAAWRKAMTPAEIVAYAVHGGPEPAETNEYLRQERRKVEATAMRQSVQIAKLNECVREQTKLICELRGKNKKLEECID